MPEHRYLSIITIFTCAIIAAAMLYGYQFMQADDAHIFYSYAKNLANGNGYVFNPDERVNATTSPLYTLLLALFLYISRSIPGITIPLIGQVIGAVSLIGMCWFLMLSFKSERSSLFPFLVPLILLTSPLLPQAVGMEMYLAMMLGIISLFYYSQHRLRSAALIVSLAALARPDMLLLAIVLAVYDVVRYRRFPTLGMLALFIVPIATWLVFSGFYFGGLLPSTFEAKLIQPKIGLWGPGPVFIIGLTSGNAWFGGSTIAQIAVVILSLGVAVAIMRWKQWSLFQHPVFQIILFWNTLYLIVYGFILQAPAYEWYYAPLALSMTLIIALPIVEVDNRLIQLQVPHKLLIPLIYTTLIAVGFIFPIIGMKQPKSAPEENYRNAAEWLNNNADLGSSVGTNCIGVLRFHYEKGTVIDGAGLVTPEVIVHLRSRDFAWYVHYFRPDYLLFQDPAMPGVEDMVYEEWFKERYEFRKSFRTRWHGAALYQRL